MSLVSMVIEDADEYSLSSSINSDDGTDALNCHTHRSCSLSAVCNSKTHQHSLIDPTTSRNLSKNSKPVKGAIRLMDHEPEHRQKYDGLKWRRICSNSDCTIYLNGGVFHENWLCRKHYLLHLSTDQCSMSDQSISIDTQQVLSKTKRSEKTCTRPSKKQTKHHKRGDIRIDPNGVRQKYNGKVWRSVCHYENCNSYIVTYGYCHRHNIEIRKKKSEILSSLDDIPQRNSTPTIRSTREKPKKGDIHAIRQQWNGTKWYSLCNHYTQNCLRRSGGIKYAYLCDLHYREHLVKEKERGGPILLSPRVKRKKSTNYEYSHLSNNTDTSNITPCQSTIDHVRQIEQCIQTDLTCPLESNDLRQGCFFVDDEDVNDRDQPESPELMAYIKKEEGNHVNNKRKLPLDFSSLALNCKLEITKLEF